MNNELEIFKKRTELLLKNAACKKRYVFNQGGTGSSKTYSILMLIYLIAFFNQGVIISCVSESLPHCKRGMIRDFKKIMIENDIWQPENYNKSDQIYKVGESTIEFFGVDAEGKVHGGRRDYLFVNEIQNISYEIFYQLASRTRKRIYADYNPTSEFWVHEKYLYNEDYDSQVNYIHSTYKDNPYLEESIVKDILTRANKDENYKRVYIDGLPGILEGLIYSNYFVIDDFPGNEYVIGLDFGYTNNPTAICRVHIKNDNIYIDELCYQKEMDNTAIARFIIESGYSERLVIADNEPKSIAEIQGYGLNIIAAEKPPESVRHGIQFVQQHNIYITKRSLNVLKEIRGYSWVIDKKTDKPLNEPLKINDHAMDAMRYAAVMAYSNIFNQNIWAC